jgi:transcriptional regulator CtsR
MSKEFNGLKKEYRPRSGQIAVELGFITKTQLMEAINEQVDDDLSHRAHRFLVEILVEKEWINREQVDIILDELYKDEMRRKGKL